MSQSVCALRPRLFHCKKHDLAVYIQHCDLLCVVPCSLCMSSVPAHRLTHAAAWLHLGIVPVHRGHVSSAAEAGASGGALSAHLSPCADWDKCLGCNVKGYAFGMKHAARAMILHKKEGSIINVASISAWIAQPGWCLRD